MVLLIANLICLPKSAPASWTSRVRSTLPPPQDKENNHESTSISVTLPDQHPSLAN